MSLNNFLPPNRENIGYKVFPLPDKSIRLDDPNYIHYAPTLPVFGDRFTTTERRDSSGSYHAPEKDDRTIFRTHVSMARYRRSQSGSVAPVSPQRVDVSPTKDEIQYVVASPGSKSATYTNCFQYPPPENTGTPEQSDFPEAHALKLDSANLVDDQSHFHAIDDSILKQDDDQSPIEARRIILENNESQPEENQNESEENLEKSSENPSELEGNQIRTEENLNLHENQDKIEENLELSEVAQIEENEDRLYAEILPREQRVSVPLIFEKGSPETSQFDDHVAPIRSDQQNETLEVEYEMVVGSISSSNVQSIENQEIESINTLTLTPPSSISEEEHGQNSHPEELKHATSNLIEVEINHSTSHTSDKKENEIKILEQE